MRESHVVIPIFVPHKGCPHDCIFCNQKKISGRTEDMTVSDMRSIIEAHLATIPQGTSVEIGFYGGSFTGIDKKAQIEFLSAANEYIKDGRVSKIRLSTRPDYINTEIVDYLLCYNVGTVELGVQSLDEEVLSASHRGHSIEDVYISSHLIKEAGIMLGLQTMVGLPLDTREKDINTALQVIKLAPSVVRIYPVLVIRGTYLEKLMLNGSYTPLALEEAVTVCTELMDLYEDAGINVIRVGLQSSENISEGSDVIGGPAHPAFRQLVEARRALKKIENIIQASCLGSKDRIIIRTGAENISNVIGQKRVNIRYLQQKYLISEIKVESSKTMHKEIEVLC